MYDRQKERSLASCRPILLFHWSNMRGCCASVAVGCGKKRKEEKNEEEERSYILQPTNVSTAKFV